MALVTYKLDGVDFAIYGVHVSKSSGLISRPKPKKADGVDWANMHGVAQVVEETYCDVRNIKLTCFIKASTRWDYVTQLNNFARAFDAPGTHRLEIVIDGSHHPLIYEVAIDGDIDPDKTWSDSTMIGTFTLKMREDMPIKKLYTFKPDSSDYKRELVIDSDKALTIYWGDGSVDYDVMNNGPVMTGRTYGQDGIVTVKHEFSAQTYEHDTYILIAGNIEEISSITAENLTLVWSIY